MSPAPANDYQIKAGIDNIAAFTVAGVSIITSNETAAEDINALWELFFTEQIGVKLEEHRPDDTIYAVYSDYEGDHTKPYRYTIGYRVSEPADKNGNGDASLPKELHYVKCNEGEYAALTASGPQPQSIIETWTAIWESDMPRAFNTDFEIYGPRFFEEGINEALIYIGLKKQT